MLSKRKILSNVLKISGIFLASACTSFDWDPKPFVGDSVNSQIVNESGESVKCDQPIFDTYTCFDPNNIAELKTAIDQLKSSKREKRHLKSVINRAFKTNLK